MIIAYFEVYEKYLFDIGSIVFRYSPEDIQNIERSLDMNLKQLEYFTAVAQAGSISAAARSLHISQPPLSTQLHLLEEELGTALFERGARSIRLTDAGRTLYTRALSILDLADTAVREVQDIGSGLAGTLSVGTISSCGTALLQTRLPAFCRLCPDVRFEIHEGNTFELIEKLGRGIIELAIVRTPFQTDGLDCLYLREEPMAAAGHPSYFAAMPDGPLSLSDLADTPLIYYRRFDPLFSAAFTREGISPAIFCKNDDARTSLLWADAGLGVALVPLSIVSVIHPDSTAVRVLGDPSLITRIAVIRRRDRYHSAAAGRFFDFWKESGDWIKAPGEESKEISGNTSQAAPSSSY